VTNVIEINCWRVPAILVILGLICSAALGPVPCSAAEVWSDNFNDRNIDDWSISDYNGGSQWTAVGGVLKVNQTIIGAIYHDSTEVVGTWSFDIRTCSNPSPSRANDIAVFFMSTEPTFYVGENPMIGYAFQQSPASIEGEMKHVFSIRKKTAEMDSISRALVLKSYVGDSADSRWYHVDVTRSENGQMTAFLNGTRILQAHDTDFDTSECVVCVGTMHQCFDNILVDDTPPPPELPIWLLALGAGAVAVVLGIVVVLKRR
jgi:hypothetical protein